MVASHLCPHIALPTCDRETLVIGTHRLSEFNPFSRHDGEHCAGGTHDVNAFAREVQLWPIRVARNERAALSQRFEHTAYAALCPRPRGGLPQVVMRPAFQLVGIAAANRKDVSALSSGFS